MFHIWASHAADGWTSPVSSVSVFGIISRPPRSSREARKLLISSLIKMLFIVGGTRMTSQSFGSVDSCSDDSESDVSAVFGDHWMCFWRVNPLASSAAESPPL